MSSTAHPRSSSLRSRVMQGGTVLFGRQATSMIVGVVGILAVTRLLGPTAYGTFASISSLYLFFFSIVQTSLGTFLVRRADTLSRSDYQAAQTFAFLVGTAALAGIAGASPQIGRWVHIEHFQRVLITYFLLFPFNLMSTVASAKLEAELRFRPIAISELGQQIISYAVGIALVFLGLGVWGLIISFAVAKLYEFVIVHAWARFFPRPRWHWSLVKDALTFSLSFSISSWLWQMKSLANPLIVGHFLGEAAVGQVGLTVRIVEVLSMARTVTWRLAVPTMSKIKNEPERLGRLVEQASLFQILGIGIPLVCFSFLSPTLILWFYGKKWGGVPELLPFLICGSLGSALFNMHSAALYVFDKPAVVLRCCVSYVAIYFVCIVLLISYFGLLALGFAECAAMAAYILLWAPVSYKAGTPRMAQSLLLALAFGAAAFSAQNALTLLLPFLAMYFSRHSLGALLHGTKLRLRSLLR